jgi:hypothetical protein
MIHDQSATRTVRNSCSREVWRLAAGETEFRVLVGAEVCGRRPTLMEISAGSQVRGECSSRTAWRRGSPPN